MNADERSRWIDRSVKYLRLVATQVDSIVITTKTGDTIEFKSNDIKDFIGKPMCEGNWDEDKRR